jgi:D-alanyl-D-alanine carboxypeptidase
VNSGLRSGRVLTKKPAGFIIIGTMRKLRGPVVYLFLLGLIILVGVYLPRETTKGAVNYKAVKTEKISPLAATASVLSASPPFINTKITAKLNTQISSGIIITDQGDNLLVLVNKHIRLPSTYEPGDLVSLDGLVPVTGPGMRLRKEAAASLAKTTEKAKGSGINLVVLSAYRSYWQQNATFNYWVSKAGLQEAETFSAHPGFSQHQLGTAVDFADGAAGQNFDQSFDATAKGIWLATNAFKFGFALSYPKGKEAITGYSYEPWHYRYIGVENAAKMIQSGLILEEFLQKFGVV